MQNEIFFIKVTSEFFFAICQSTASRITRYKEPCLITKAFLLRLSSFLIRAPWIINIHILQILRIMKGFPMIDKKLHIYFSNMLHFYKLRLRSVLKYLISDCRNLRLRMFDSGCTLYKTELEILPTYM